MGQDLWIMGNFPCRWERLHVEGLGAFPHMRVPGTEICSQTAAPDGGLWSHILFLPQCACLLSFSVCCEPSNIVYSLSPSCGMMNRAESISPL